MLCKLTYVFHSCFLLETERAAVVFDYWKDSANQVLAKFLKLTTKRVYFLSSHFHEDHFNPEILHFEVPKGEKRVLLSRDIQKYKKIGDENVTKFLRLKEVFEDDLIRITVCGSTDSGVSFVVELSGLCVYHAGDNNNWYFSDQASERDLKMVEGSFLAIVRDIKKIFPHFDFVMFPLDPRLGPEMGRGALQWLKNIPTDAFVPMHFSVEPYEPTMSTGKQLLQSKTQFVEIHSEGEELVIKNVL